MSFLLHLPWYAYPIAVVVVLVGLFVFACILVGSAFERDLDTGY